MVILHDYTVTFSCGCTLKGRFMPLRMWCHKRKCKRGGKDAE